MLAARIKKALHAKLVQDDGGLPLLGHALAFRKDAPALLSRRAGTVPLGSLRLMSRTIQVAGSPTFAEYVLRSGAKNFSRGTPVYRLLGLFLGQGTLVTEGETWRKHRRVIQPAFHKRRLEALTGQVVQVIDAHLRKWIDGDHVFDARDAMMHLTLELASSILVGARTKRDAEALGEAVDAGQVFVQRLLPFPWLAGLEAVNKRFIGATRRILDEIAFRLIRERRDELRQNPSADHNDALAMLLEARYEDGLPMSDRQIRDEMMTLLVAGHETTSNAISWTLWYLAQHPEAQRELEAEVDRVLGTRVPTFADMKELTFTRAVFDESMRLRPPAWVTGRICTRTHEFEGVRFEEGQLVLISPWVVHSSCGHLRGSGRVRSVAMEPAGGTSSAHGVLSLRWRCTKMRRRGLRLPRGRSHPRDDHAANAPRARSWQGHTGTADHAWFRGGPSNELRTRTKHSAIHA